jgi:hypothetical protein
MTLPGLYQANIAARARARRSQFKIAIAEPLEVRRLLSFNATFPNGATLTQRSDTDASRQPGEESECTIVINPTNPRNVVAFSIPPDPLDYAWYSFDGGSTYARSVIPRPQIGTLASHGDPAGAFDRQGNLYYAHLTISAGGGRGVSIAKSLNGGQTWPQEFAIEVDDGDGELLDKPWITVGPDPSNPSQDIVYVAYVKFHSEGGQFDTQLYVARSLDGGASFSTSAIINDDSIAGIDGIFHPRPVVRQSDGRLYLVWHDITSPGEIMIDYSDNGGVTWQNPPQGADQLIGTTSFNAAVIDAQPDRLVYSASSLALAQTGPFANRLYAAYTIGSPNATDIQVAWSDSPTGATGTWNYSVPHTITTNSQFLPWIETDPMTGVPYVSWLDAKDSPTNKTVRKTGTFSINGGVNWQPPVTVADAASDQSTDNPHRFSFNYA